jgi:hypothetical protein
MRHSWRGTAAQKIIVGANETKAIDRAGPYDSSSAKEPHYLNAIDPSVPAKLLSGPAVKNSRFLGPFFPMPSPKSIPQSWSMWKKFEGFAAAQKEHGSINM